jgi:hypothetical protein
MDIALSFKRPRNPGESLGDVRGGAGEAQGRRKGRKVDSVRNNAYISDRKKAM